MTEASIQEAFPGQPGDLALIPNCAALGHEADLLRVTKNRDVFEYEIKVTRADFRADAKKQHRKILAAEVQSGQLAGKYAFGWPNRLYYVAPVGVIPHDELPAYAGLIECEKTPNGIMFHPPVKRGRRLHNESISDRALDYVLRGLTIRYWQARRQLKLAAAA